MALAFNMAWKTTIPAYPQVQRIAWLYLKMSDSIWYVNIRLATNEDRDDIQRVHMRAFPEGENALVSKLAIELLSETTTPQTISLVAEAGGVVVGHVAFSPVKIDNDERFQGCILAPLGINPDYQRAGIGSMLVEYGMQKMSGMGVDMVFVYGDPEYYSRFGFSADAACQYATPYKLQYPFGWQAIALNEADVEGSSAVITCVNSLCDPELW